MAVGVRAGPSPSLGPGVRSRYRQGGLHAGSPGRCVPSLLAEPAWSDPEPIAASGWFDLVSGESCGVRGHSGLSSFGTVRDSATDCP